MLECTDRFCRYLLRLISRNAVLYTEMITTGALLHGDQDYHLRKDSTENPVGLQLGGSDPRELAAAALLGHQYGYDEINLNCGCPSDRVQTGRFGACMMAEPELVADCIAAMREAVDIPITVKHRIGIDDSDDYKFMCHFVEKVSTAGCSVFVVHARKAILSGLSPKQNREIPPLDYPRVYQLKRDFPHLEIIINGGITDLSQAQEHLQYVDGVMLGREAYHNPYLLARVDAEIYGNTGHQLSREEVSAGYLAFIASELENGTRIHYMARHLLGLFHGVPGARAFRRHISENIHKPDASLDTLETALQFMAGPNT